MVFVRSLPFPSFPLYCHTKYMEKPFFPMLFVVVSIAIYIWLCILIWHIRHWYKQWKWWTWWHIMYKLYLVVYIYMCFGSGLKLNVKMWMLKNVCFYIKYGPLYKCITHILIYNRSGCFFFCFAFLLYECCFVCLLLSAYKWIIFGSLLYTYLKKNILYSEFFESFFFCLSKQYTINQCFV